MTDLNLKVPNEEYISAVEAEEGDQQVRIDAWRVNIINENNNIKQYQQMIANAQDNVADLQRKLDALTARKTTFINLVTYLQSQ